MGLPTVLYSGPGKVTSSIQGTSYGFHGEGVNGAVKMAIAEKRTKRSSGTFGYHKSTLDDQSVVISLTPFDSWANLPALYPAYLGIGTGGSTTSDLVIGTRPHDWAAGTGGAVSANGTAASTIWTPDGRLYTVARTGIIKHPGMKLGVGQPLFTGMEISGLVPIANNIGASSGLYAVTDESGGSDPGPAFVSDFINGHWTGAWASITGFTTMDAEDGWELTVDAKYSPLTVQKRTAHYKLDSVEVMVKGRVAGPTHTQLTSKILAHTLGGILAEGSASNLVLTGPSSKTITLYDCEVFLDNDGFEFGGNRLGTGVVTFVTQIDFTSGAPAPALVFSS